MLLAASLLAFSLTNSPAQACITPTQTGIYRIIATTKDSSNASVGLVLLENVGNCLEASIIADDGAPAMIENIALKDNVLTGRVHMRTGNAEVTLRLSQKELTGSIVAPRQSWVLSGRRTTGDDVRSADGDVAPVRSPSA
jgi:hypothetical protein